VLAPLALEGVQRAGPDAVDADLRRHWSRE
jgi:hypothetical protein